MTHAAIAFPSTRPTLAPLWWFLAFVAMVVPTLVAIHHAPSVTFYNQVLAVFGWGWLVAALSAIPTPRAQDASNGVWAIGLMLVLNTVLALRSGLWGHLPGGLSMMSAGLSFTALLVLATGWRVGVSPLRLPVSEAFFGALALAGLAGLALSWIQVFQPSLADGVWIAEPTVVGRAVGNLRQPNHFSTLMVWACCGIAWLGGRRRVPAWLASLLIALFIACVVWTASRTGMVAMLLLALWGALDRGLPRALRMTLLAAPVIYAAWWAGMYGLSQADKHVAFAAAARLHDGSDISSSRFKIWANVIELIRQHPWTGVGVGEFNVAWTLTPFPGRPVAFFDHTHNLPLQWAVENGVPAAALMLALCLGGYMALFRQPAWGKTSSASSTNADSTAAAAAVMVTAAGLHSLLEYPLWYSYFLLPTAFAWGLGLACRHATPSVDKLTADAPTTHSSALLVAGLLTALMAMWCAADYQTSVNIYAPRSGAGPLADRIALGQRMPWFGYQADYAAATGPEENEPSLPPSAFRRTLHNLLDARLMISYARSLAEHGQVDKARYVIARLKEFHNTMGDDFLEACEDVVPPHQAPPFQCSPPQKSYTWRELLPD